jgi:hypothetical protein
MFTAIRSFNQKLRLKSRLYSNKLDEDGQLLTFGVGVVSFAYYGLYRISTQKDYEYTNNGLDVKDFAVPASVALFTAVGMSTGLLPKGLVLFIIVIAALIPCAGDPGF